MTFFDFGLGFLIAGLCFQCGMVEMFTGRLQRTYKLVVLIVLFSLAVFFNMLSVLTKM